MSLRTTSSMSEEPPAPDITEEARSVLTPDQSAQWEKQRKLPQQQQEILMQSMQNMAPAAITTLQELLSEKNQETPAGR